jgi:preprotein translocase subunit SecD
MIFDRSRFNTYLLSVVALALVSGCHTRGDKKEIATLRVHLEVMAESMDFSTSVPIYRAKPVMVTVDKSPFLSEANVAGAKVVDVPGGFKLEIHFDHRGTWLLESYTTTNPGKHFAIFSAFEFQKKKEGRWLGAPIQSRRISNGILAFTPDATREEAEQIVRGLTNIAKENQDKSKW